jgi:hypothetical protein
MLEYVALSGFVKTAIAEANYQIKLGDSWTLTPGIPLFETNG